jgi:acetyl-CoA carboxylase biotin carboxylase subunit
MNPITKLLIANRGEIAVRVIRTARNMGIRTVAIYSAIDADSLHVTRADEAWCIDGVELSDTYLNIPKIIDIALQTGCQAIHPGYGFLAENPRFVHACEKAGLLFIGPGTEAMRIMGNKIEAREFVKKINIPMTAGVTGTPEELEKAAESIGFPVLLKAAAGGGGKGMKIVYRKDDLADAIESTSRQALAYFGDDTVYIEKFIEEPRHIEVQILGDNHGNVIHLFERECSIQRRYQKIIEESPSPTLTPAVRHHMGAAAVAIGKAIGYNNAGTIEFLVDRDLNFYFLEMNTRIQVEHPVTELVTGIDIVEEQILVASGNPLRIKQEEITQHGHAIECRIYAEDPSNNFQPSPGRMTLYREPALDGIRIDTGITAGTEIKSAFDPMISKLIIHGKDRHEATQKMIRALDEYIIHGIRTNISYLVRLLQGEAFRDNRMTTKFCDEHTAALAEAIRHEQDAMPLHIPVFGYLLYTLAYRKAIALGTSTAPSIWESVGYWRNRMHLTFTLGDVMLMVEVGNNAGNHYQFTVQGETYRVVPVSWSLNRIEFTIDHHMYTAWISEDSENHAWVTIQGHIFRMQRSDLLAETAVASGFDRHGHDSDHVTSPMPGKVIKILVSKGDTVKKGDVMLIIEAMKMENQIVSPRDAVVASVNVSVNDRVESSTILASFDE